MRFFLVSHCSLVRHPIRRIVLTPGEPAGIGPDLCLIIAQQQLDCELVVIANPKLLKERAACLDLQINLHEFNINQPVQLNSPGNISVLPVDLVSPAIPGKLDRLNSHYVLKAITRATKGCMEGLFDAMVTGPVHKGIINESGIAFSGHTEYIAEITGGHPVMMLATSGLRVALATTHLPLRAVSAAITHHRLRSVIRTLQQNLQTYFAIAKPRILVCGLNPHAGEGGHLGQEEIKVINPVLESLRGQGLDLVGPLPADTLFTPKYLTTADAVLAMYHDQGLPVLKHIGFNQAVNITLGLPIIRTSVDHGTALDLAGKNIADSGSLLYAINTAVKMANNHFKSYGA